MVGLLTAVAGVLLALSGIAWVWKSNTDRKWARASVARVEQLAAEGKYVEGYALASQVLRYLPAEPTVIRLISELYRAQEAPADQPPPGNVKTEIVANPKYWEKVEGNVDDVIFTPIANDATRVAALISGEIDMMDPVPLQDIAKVNANPNLKVTWRIVFLNWLEPAPGGPVRATGCRAGRALALPFCGRAD